MGDEQWAQNKLKLSQYGLKITCLGVVIGILIAKDIRYACLLVVGLLAMIVREYRFFLSGNKLVWLILVMLAGYLRAIPYC